MIDPAGAGRGSTASSRSELMPPTRFPFVAGPHAIDAVFVIGIFVAVGLAFALFGFCGGGASLALFGVAVALLGYTLGRSNAWATIIPICIVTLTLVGAGVYAASLAGCLL